MSMKRVKQPVVEKVVREVVVAVINIFRFRALLLICSLFSFSGFVAAAVLPDDRIDVMYHSYDGGGVSIDGPSILLSKNIADTVSLSANYYVDMISGASIDVEATASAYSEERKEYSLGADYLIEKTTLSLSYTNSNEDDYQAETVGFRIKQDFFGDLSTLSLGVSSGSDTVSRNGDDNFEADAEHRRYALTWTQILTQKLIASASIETVADEGFLNNPYRSVRYKDSSSKGYSYESELYPETRNSDAFALRGIYHLPYRASVKAEFRTYTDSWGVAANNYELRYTHAYGDNWIFEAKWRQYQQGTGADFYSDLFDYSEQTNYRARDKELSEYTSSTFGLGVTYLLPDSWSILSDRNTINFYWDRMNFDYQNFRNVLVHDDPGSNVAAGSEDLYNFDADVIRLYWSVKF